MKNILITGISRGLGLLTARTLLENNYRVYGVCRNITEDLNKLTNAFDNQLQIIQYDLEDDLHIKDKIFGNILYKIPLHGVINNAAIAYDDLITNIDLNMLNKLFKINVISPIIIVKYSIKNMLYHKIGGSFVHISSISAHTGYKGLGMYASTKGALEAFSKNLAREWGEKKIRSNAVVVGFMETDMSSTLTKEQKDRIYKRTALKEPVNIKSVANLIEFLISDKSKSITGQNIFIDSGTI